MDARKLILESAEALIREKGVHATTISDISSRANCAKGLINYHFGSKASLISILSDRVVELRLRQWKAALSARTPHDAVDRSWRLLKSEAASGTVKLWDQCIDRGDNMTDQSVSIHHQSFATGLGKIAVETLRHAELTPRIPLSELGSLLAVVVHGAGKMLAAGIDPVQMEGAYAAAWLGILSLTN